MASVSRPAASQPAITLEVLPACYGDCLLATCNSRAGQFRILVDAGPDGTWPTLRERLRKIPMENGRRHIDLAIVTHIDHDHIGGARLLFEDEALGLTFGDVWFNARHHLTRGVAEGKGLAEILGAPERELPWNVAFDGGPVKTPREGGFIEAPSSPDGPCLTILSPTPKRLSSLARVWDAELEKLRQGKSNTDPEPSARGAVFPDLESLAAARPRRDGSAPNGSSIVILVEHQGSSVLLTGDAFSNTVGASLLSLSKERGSVPIQVNALKLSHHGSRANFRRELLEVVQAEHYIVSTDNSRYGHPNDETLATIILEGQHGSTFWFNYATDQNLRWKDEGLQEQYEFSASYPKAGTEGITLSLG